MTTIDPIATSVITVTLLVLVTACSVTDIKSRRIPNLFLATALSLAFICHGFDSGISGLFGSFVGLLIGMALLMPIYMVGGTGAGDVKLLGVVGALLGSHGVLVAGVATLVSGGLLGVAWMLWRILDAVVATHFVRFTQLRSAGLSHVDVSASKVKILGTSFPYAPAIACGTYVAIWYFGLLGPIG